jgi:hypothetical protein
MKTDGVQFTPFIFSLSNAYTHFIPAIPLYDGQRYESKIQDITTVAPVLKFDNKASVYGDKRILPVYIISWTKKS